MIRRLGSDVVSELRCGVAVTSVSQCVEELVFNSLDADSSCITIDVDICSASVEVSDNGTGMHRNDLKNMGNRYFTSKCHNLSDLENVSSYGFRGEAVASLGKICEKMEVVSRHKTSYRTFCKHFRRGVDVGVYESTDPRSRHGTTVVAHGIFYTLPVRQKLISSSLDLERIRRCIAAIAIVHPNISFILRNKENGCTILQTHRSLSILSAISQVFGCYKSKAFKQITGALGMFRVSGYVNLEGHSNKNFQFFYLNKRLVLKTKLHKLANRILSKGLSQLPNENTVSVFQIGKAVSPKSRNGDKYPGFVINLECPHNVYDITFDPAKTLVEFQNWDDPLLCLTQCLNDFLVKEGVVIEAPSNEFMSDSPARCCDGSSSSPEESLGGDQYGTGVEGPGRNGVLGKWSISPSDLKRCLYSATAKRKPEIEEGDRRETSVTNCAIPGQDQSPSLKYRANRSVSSSGKVLGEGPILMEDGDEFQSDSSFQLSIIGGATSNEVANFSDSQEFSANTRTPPKSSKTQVSKNSSICSVLQKFCRRSSCRSSPSVNNVGHSQLGNMHGSSGENRCKSLTGHDHQNRGRGWLNCGKIRRKTTLTSVRKKAFYSGLKALSELNTKSPREDNQAAEPREDLIKLQNGRLGNGIQKIRRYLGVIKHAPLNKNNKDDIAVFRNSEVAVLDRSGADESLGEISTNQRMDDARSASGHGSVCDDYSAAGVHHATELLADWEGDGDDFSSSIQDNDCLVTASDLAAVDDSGMTVTKNKTRGDSKAVDSQIPAISSSTVMRDSLSTLAGSRVMTCHGPVSDSFKVVTCPLTNDVIKPGKCSIDADYQMTADCSSEVAYDSLIVNDCKQMDDHTAGDDCSKDVVGSRTVTHHLERDNNSSSMDERPTGEAITQDTFRTEDTQMYVSMSKDDFSVSGVLGRKSDYEAMNECETADTSCGGGAKSSDDIDMNNQSEWICQHDSRHGRMVYVNLRTGNTSLENPSIEKDTLGFIPESKAEQRRILHPFASHLSHNFTPWLPRNVSPSPGDGENLAKCENRSSKIDVMLDSWVNPVFESNGKPVANASFLSTNKTVVRAHRATQPFNFTKEFFKDVKVIKQLDKKFIVCHFKGGSSDDVLVVVDQHAAHERVRLENFTKDLYSCPSDEAKAARIKSTFLLSPLKLFFSADEVRLMHAFRTQLEDIGILFEETQQLLSHHQLSVGIKAVPSVLLGRELQENDSSLPQGIENTVEELIKEQLEVLLCTRGAYTGVPRSIVRTLNSQACHGAIRFGDQLTTDQCQDLMASLSKCDLPFQCAHGRPSMIPLIDMKLIRKKMPKMVTKPPQLWRVRQRMRDEQL